MAGVFVVNLIDLLRFAPLDGWGVYSRLLHAELSISAALYVSQTKFSNCLFLLLSFLPVGGKQTRTGNKNEKEIKVLLFLFWRCASLFMMWLFGMAWLWLWLGMAWRGKGRALWVMNTYLWRLE